MFMNMVLKSMREATPKDGMLDSEQGKMFGAMLDQQLSQNMSKRGIGLADLMIKQLSQVPVQAPEVKNSAVPVTPIRQDSEHTRFGMPSGQNGAVDQKRAAFPVAPSVTGGSADLRNQSQATQRLAHVQAFQDKLAAHAAMASQETGIPPRVLLSQAALESGWGRREIRNADGTGSHNLFGIKAGSAWKGKVVQVTTTEYVDGVASKKVQTFRAYDSYGDAFRDYAHLLKHNPRYEKALAAAGDPDRFAHELQQAGYATDPNYAQKLLRLMRSMPG
jgi:flagellar protein FlgJ